MTLLLGGALLQQGPFFGSVLLGAKFQKFQDLVTILTLSEISALQPPRDV
jgi:hypothetical protein